MAGGGGGLAGVSRGSGERREAGSADEPRTEPELERAAGGGRAGGRERGAPGPGPGAGAGALWGPSGGQVPEGSRAGGGSGPGRGVRPAQLGSRLRPRARGAGSARGGGCGGARAPGGAGTCGSGETEPRRVRGKAVLILTPNVFGESCRRGTLEGGGVEATDRLTATAGESPLLPSGQVAPSLEATSLKFRVVPGGGSYPLNMGAASCIKREGPYYRPLPSPRCLVWPHYSPDSHRGAVRRVGRGSFTAPVRGCPSKTTSFYKVEPG